MRTQLLLVATLTSTVAATACGGGSGGPSEPSFSWSDAVVYRVELDRFANGDETNDPAALAGVLPAADYHGGDLAGLLEKLQGGYFHDLGVNVLCLSSPASAATGSGMLPDSHLSAAYHGEWPIAPAAIDVRFGTMAQLQAITGYAHQQGIRVVAEHTLKHVHSSAPVFAQHPEWFWPVCVLGSAECPWDTAGLTGWIADYLPAFDYGIAAGRGWSVQQAVTLVTTTGLDGLLLVNEQLTDPAAIEDLRRALAAQRSPTGASYLLLGDHFTGDPAKLAADVAPATRLDGQLDLPLRAQVLEAVLIKSISMTDFATFLGGQAARYTGPMGLALGTPYAPRVVEFALDTPLYDNPWANGGDRAWSSQPTLPTSSSAFDRAGLAAAVTFGLPGMPVVYYGDEVGLPGAGAPDNRRDMPWTGLTTDQTALAARLAKLASVRAAHLALRRGTWSLISSTADTIAWQMSLAGDTVYVLVNRSDTARSVGGLPGVPLRDELDGSAVSGPAVEVAPRSARFLAPGA